MHTSTPTTNTLLQRNQDIIHEHLMRSFPEGYTAHALLISETTSDQLHVIFTDDQDAIGQLRASFSPTDLLVDPASIEIFTEGWRKRLNNIINKK